MLGIKLNACAHYLGMAWLPNNNIQKKNIFVKKIDSVSNSWIYFTSKYTTKRRYCEDLFEVFEVSFIARMGNSIY